MIQSDYLYRLALVVNTSHSKFEENLENLLIYVLSNDNMPCSTVEELRSAIQEQIGIEFTDKEILDVLNQKKNSFIKISATQYGLTDSGKSKMKYEAQSQWERLINEFTKVYSLNKSTDEVYDLIHKYIYGFINNNIESLLRVIREKTDIFYTEINEEFTIEEKSIINAFIDWENSEKDKFLYKLISFSVDYCRLTVKKDANSFKSLLNGKKFYLDANIIFRMMGLNGENRKDSTNRFISKCREANIQLCVTSITRQEMKSTIKHHVNVLKNTMQGYHGNGKAVKSLCNSFSNNDGFIEEYINWVASTGSVKKFDDFEQMLMSRYYGCLNDVTFEDVKKIVVTEEMVDDYTAHKGGAIRRENAEYDLKNVEYIENLREKRKQNVGWNTCEYLISADHKLISWAMKNKTEANPIVVLPSVWYSVILKITGRVDDDLKSFTEFIKMRYQQEDNTESVGLLIDTVCRKTSNGIVQDMLFDEISEKNQQLEKLDFKDEEAVVSLVDESYDDIIIKSEVEGYKKGQKEGQERGYSAGIDIGEKIGSINEKIRSIENEKLKKAPRVRCLNIFVMLAFFGLLVVFIWFLSSMLLPENYLGEYQKYKRIIESLFTIVPYSFLAKFLLTIFPIEPKKIKELLDSKYAYKLKQLKDEQDKLKQL